jgi:hypothetical protein
VSGTKPDKSPADSSARLTSVKAASTALHARFVMCGKQLIQNNVVKKYEIRISINALTGLVAEEHQNQCP